jgi:Cell shape-determining protein
LVFIAGLAGYGITIKSVYEFLILRPVSSVLNFINQTFTSLNDYLLSIRYGKTLITENENLKNYIATLESRLKMLLGNYYENIELKNLLGIKSKFKFETLGCSVTMFSKVGNFMIIDKGKDSNLKVDMPVVYSIDGNTLFLVGKIIQVSANSSKVTLETSPNFKVGVKNVARGGIDIAEGNGETLTVKRPFPGVNDTISDVFVTVEESGIFPPDIVVGKVVSINKVSSVENELTLSPMIDFYTIRNVLVVTSYGKNKLILLLFCDLFLLMLLRILKPIFSFPFFRYFYISFRGLTNLYTLSFAN